MDVSLGGSAACNMRLVMCELSSLSFRPVSELTAGLTRQILFSQPGLGFKHIKGAVNVELKTSGTKSHCLIFPFLCDAAQE